MGRKKKSTSTKGSNKKGNNTKTNSNKDLIQDVKKKLIDKLISKL
ncbi:hypothetical protein [Romboutsia faecis]|nr:hypothetical protein [Romboutsia faecis]